jgi:hypothetical protein
VPPPDARKHLSPLTQRREAVRGPQSASTARAGDEHTGTLDESVERTHYDELTSASEATQLMTTTSSNTADARPPKRLTARRLPRESRHGA